MWNATITEVKKLVDRVEVVVAYTDGKDILTEKYVTTCPQEADWMDANIKRKLTHLEALAPFALTLSAGVFVPATAKAVPVDTAKDAFLATLDEYWHYQRASAIGLAVDAKAMDDCLTQLKALWKPEYLEVM
jgi:hypothetical protein